MGLLKLLFKNKKEREQDKHVEKVLKRTDDFIEHTERMLDEFEEDDKRWRRNL
ncbi:MAG: hypothetical protein MJ000_03790 [Bacteroidales bacterium]|nr:hypothetical protein [Bacteroidales bacterium]